MQIRHSGLLAQAHFLQTKAEPKLVSLASQNCPSQSLMVSVLQTVGTPTRRR